MQVGNFSFYGILNKYVVEKRRWCGCRPAGNTPEGSLPSKADYGRGATILCHACSVIGSIYGNRRAKLDSMWQFNPDIPPPMMWHQVCARVHAGRIPRMSTSTCTHAHSLAHNNPCMRVCTHPCLHTRSRARRIGTQTPRSVFRKSNSVQHAALTHVSSMVHGMIAVGNYGASASAWYKLLTVDHGYGLVAMELLDKNLSRWHVHVSTLVHMHF